MFNKTVGLRDTWAKQAPKHTTNQFKPSPPQHSQRKPIDVIKQLGKKYTNLPEEKQQKVKKEIQLLAKEVSFEDLEPLFNTAAKKVGTRIATVITLNELLKKGLKRSEQIDLFVATAKADDHPLLKEEAKRL